VLVVLVLVALLILASGLWAGMEDLQDQRADVQTRVAAIPTATTTLEPKDHLALQKDLLQVENSIGAARAQVFGSLAQLVTGAAILAGLLFTWRNFRLAQSGQVTERFTKAIGQLGDEQLAVRLGGIYALEQLARDAPERYQWTVVEVLSAFVRTRAPWKGEQNAPFGEEGDRPFTETRDPPAPAADVQAVLTVLGRRVLTKEEREKTRLETRTPGVRMLGRPHLDLSGTDLRGAYLHGARFQRADLRGSNLQGANLMGARLHQADLRGASLEDADLAAADLTEATLFSARLKGANLTSARGVTPAMQKAAGYPTKLANAMRWAPSGGSTPAAPSRDAGGPTPTPEPPPLATDGGSPDGA
jgi:hypothetical protein